MYGRKGFTLAELLISVSIFAVIAICLYSTFSGGIRIWRRQEESFKYSNTARLSLDTMAKELRNSINYSTPKGAASPFTNGQALNFTGERTKVTFITRIGINIARVSYVFERGTGQSGELKRTVVLQRYGFSDDRREEEILVYGLSDVTFEYAHPKKNEKDSLPDWEDTWNQEAKDSTAQIPSGMRVTLDFRKDSLNPKDGEIIRKTIFIPQGVQGKQEGPG